jgi:hypothetical protein
MSQRIPIGRMRFVERFRETAPDLFAPIELGGSAAHLTSVPGCAHLFEMVESEDEGAYEVVEIVEPG